MRRALQTCSVIALAWLSAPAWAAMVRVDNPTGNVAVQVVPGDRVKVQSSSPARGIRKDDTSLTGTPETVEIRCHPEDGAQIDLEIYVPYESSLEITTTKGNISITGLVLYGNLVTENGSVRLSVPWRAERLEIVSDEKPNKLSTPKGLKFSEQKRQPWTLSDRLPELKITYGKIKVKAVSPGRIDLIDIPIPDDSPVKLPWQAPEILNEILEHPGQGRASTQQAGKPRAVAPEAGSGTPVFTSDVRLVNLSVAVYGRDGHPLTDLKPDDFEVLEDGISQKVTFAGSEGVPFNLALLLDLSGSTHRERPAMKEAARRFLELARPHDRVAIYALANNLFYVVSRLTEDRPKLLETIDAIPDVSGETPLYDTIVLSYAEEFRQRPNERNALIVITDGVDNQIHGTGSPSEVSFKKLRKAAAEMYMLIYPIFLDPFDKVPPPDWTVRARMRLDELAQASGGRLFPAHSVEDLEPVYPLVEEELRSVYTVAYYPQNQNFDGAWRQVEVRVQRAGAKVRTRAGYYAR